MSSKKPLFIVGAGGFGTEALWLAEEMNRRANGGVWEVLGFVDDNPERAGSEYSGLPILGTSAEVSKLVPASAYFHCAIGKNKIRERLATKLESLGFIGATLIHPSAIIGPQAKVGSGCYLGPLSIIAPHARLGNHVIINSHVGIGHHAVIGDFSNICPAAYVNGECRVDRLAFIGSNASLQPGVSVGQSASVSANSYVIRSVNPCCTVAGVPARIVSRPAAAESPAQ